MILFQVIIIIFISAIRYFVNNPAKSDIAAKISILKFPRELMFFNFSIFLVNLNKMFVGAMEGDMVKKLLIVLLALIIIYIIIDRCVRCNVESYESSEEFPTKSLGILMFVTVTILILIDYYT